MLAHGVAVPDVGADHFREGFLGALEVTSLEKNQKLVKNCIVMERGPFIDYLLQFLLDDAGPDDERSADRVLHQLDRRVDVVHRDAAGRHAAAVAGTVRGKH